MYSKYMKFQSIFESVFVLYALSFAVPNIFKHKIFSDVSKEKYAVQT